MICRIRPFALSLREVRFVVADTTTPSPLEGEGWGEGLNQKQNRRW